MLFFAAQKQYKRHASEFQSKENVNFYQKIEYKSNVSYDIIYKRNVCRF